MYWQKSKRFAFGAYTLLIQGEPSVDVINFELGRDVFD